MTPAPIARVLTILCITKCEPHARRFLEEMWSVVRNLPYTAELIVYCDVTVDVTAPALLRDLSGEQATPEGNYLRLIPNASRSGFLEAMHDDAVNCCSGEYVLRLDDDERMNRPMEDWVAAQGFLARDHWKFDRAHLWQDPYHYIADGPLWPDHQTRLSIKAKAGGRGTIHAGSPFGGGYLAPDCVIEHHVFLVRSRVEREKKLARYNQIHPGAGWPAFHTPEIFPLVLKPYVWERHPYANQ